MYLEKSPDRPDPFLVRNSNAREKDHKVFGATVNIGYLGTMSATAILNRFLDPIAQLLPTETAQQLVDLRLDSELRARIDEIADKANLYKGTNLASIDPETGLVVTLFHLRQGNWAQHFQLSGAELVGLTPQGRATVHLPKMNTPRRLELRAVLLAAGEFGS